MMTVSRQGTVWTGAEADVADDAGHLKRRLLSPEIATMPLPLGQEGTAPGLGRRALSVADGRRVLLAALALGLVVRAFIFAQTPDLGTVIVDERHYAQIASNVLDGVGFAWDASHPTSLRPPLR